MVATVAVVVAIAGGGGRRCRRGHWRWWWLPPLVMVEVAGGSGTVDYLITYMVDPYICHTVWTFFQPEVGNGGFG